MIKAVKEMAGSKKAIVYVVAVSMMAAIMFGGVDPEHAQDFIDKLIKLTMAYLGGQGLADLGKYAGQAFTSGKKVIDSRGEGSSDVVAAATAAADVADDVSGAIQEAISPASDVTKPNAGATPELKE